MLDLGVAAPYLEKTLQLWRDAQRKNKRDADHTEIYHYLARLPGAARRKPAPSRGGTARRSNLRRKRRRST